VARPETDSPTISNDRRRGRTTVVLRNGTHAMTFDTTSRAASCTSRRWSGPRNDSA
jgi:hypothetical protein